jgi:hypothetical protein
MAGLARPSMHEDLSIIFDAPTVRSLFAWMRVSEKWRFLRVQSRLAQAVPRYPTTEKQEANAQLQSGSFDLALFCTMDRAESIFAIAQHDQSLRPDVLLIIVRSFAMHRVLSSS